MKTKHVIGQRIVAINQGRTSRGHGYPPANAVHFIELENGVRLFPMTVECEADYLHEFAVNVQRLKARRQRAE